MPDSRSYIFDAQRAALADWTNQEINGLPRKNNFLEVTASLASSFTAQKIFLEDVLAILKDNHQVVGNTAAWKGLDKKYRTHDQHTFGVIFNNSAFYEG